MATTIEGSYRHRVLAVLLLGIVLIGIYGLVKGVVVARYHFYQSNVEKLQDRLQRLNNLLATRQTLNTQIQTVSQDNTADAYYLKPLPPTLAASDLQQRVKAAVESGGGSLVSTQVLPVTTEGTFSKVAIRVIMNGDTEALQKVFYELESKAPLLFVDNVSIRARAVSRRSPNKPQPIVQTLLTTQFELAGYMRGG